MHTRTKSITYRGEAEFNVVYMLYSKKSLKIPKGGNQNLYIEEKQTTQWPKEKVQKDKQRSTKHTSLRSDVCCLHVR